MTPTTALPPSRREAVATVALLALLTAAAHFALARRFGLYEDDYAFAGATLSWTATDAWAWVGKAVGPGGQGRPVGFVLGSFLPWMAWRATGGLGGMYAEAWAVLAANVSLVWAVVRRAGYPRPVAVLGAVLFCLFPADTTRPFLCHGLILQPSVSCLLVATLLYQSGGRRRRWAAYAVAAGSLLAYETAFPPFVAAPLLVAGAWDRRLVRRLSWHVAILVGVLIVAFVVRRRAGEVRAAETVGAVGGLPRRVALGLLIGPGVALRQCGARAAEMYLHPGTAAMAVAAAGPLAVAVAVARRRPAATGASGGPASPPPPPGSAHGPAVAPNPPVGSGPIVARGLVTGGVLLVSAYALSFTHYPPDATYGRMTSVHTAAAPGAAVASATLLYAGLVAARATRATAWAATAAVGLYLGGLFAFAVTVQQGFAVEWREQRRYWSDVLRLCPDAGAGTTLVLEGPYLPESFFVLTRSWADYKAWDALHAGRPRAAATFVDFDGVGDHLDWRAGRFHWARLKGFQSDAGEDQMLVPGRTILLRVRDYRLYRATGTVAINGHPLALQPAPPAPGPAVPPDGRGPLYGLLIR